MEDSRLKELFTAEERLAFVERSPVAVTAKDKAGWVGLFARFSLVEDPVGSSPHVTGIYDGRTGYRGRDALGNFYDTFIAPNTIRFHVDRDSVCGMHVMRDLVIEIEMSPRVTVRVPVHLLYELTVEQGELKILRLAAHWELWPMLKQQIATGLPFLQVGAASFGRMLRHMGLGGVSGFMRALGGVGASGKERIVRLVAHFNASDAAALQGLFASADTAVDFPFAGRRLSIAQMVGEGGEIRVSKVLAAGNVISATLDYHRGSQRYRGVALFELDRRSLDIVAATFYWSP